MSRLIKHEYASLHPSSCNRYTCVVYIGVAGMSSFRYSFKSCPVFLQGRHGLRVCATPYVQSWSDFISGIKNISLNFYSEGFSFLLTLLKSFQKVYAVFKWVSIWCVWLQYIRISQSELAKCQLRLLSVW